MSRNAKIQHLGRAWQNHQSRKWGGCARSIDFQSPSCFLIAARNARLNFPAWLESLQKALCVSLARWRDQSIFSQVEQFGRLIRGCVCKVALFNLSILYRQYVLPCEIIVHDRTPTIVFFVLVLSFLLFCLNACHCSLAFCSWLIQLGLFLIL